MLKNKIILRFCFYLPIFAYICLLISPDISYSQGRDRSKFQLVIDTSLSRRDTSKTIDTTRHYEPLDSTARLKYFKYDRKDQLNPLFGIEKSSILLYNSSGVDYQLTFDSLDNVIITESVNGEEIKYPLKIPLDKYLAIRGDLENKEQLYKVVADNYKIETGDELEKIFKNITDITIPLPFTSETIFGPPTLNFKVNGLIDITASYERSSSDQQTASFISPTQNNINFKQEVQVTTKGTIGDKLSVDADWNSQRTFDYENQLKLKYTGYADEVIQSLEAGNVSLETKSNLIGSTQALFGIKGQFKLGPLSLTAIASQKKSEKKEVDITGGSQEVNFEIPAYQYSTNHYFLDTLYDTSYEELYTNGSLVSTHTINNEVSPDIEVWVQTTPTNPQKRFAVCWIGLDYEPHPSGYNDTLHRTDSTFLPQYDGVKTSGWFVKLTPDQYTLQPQAGYITLNVNLPNNGLDAVAVAYRLAHNPTVNYGTYSNESNLVLKLVRFPNLQPPTQNPAHRKAWKLQIKSIYSVGVRNLKNDPSKLDFSIFYKPPSGDNQTTITVPTPPNNALVQHSYLNLVGLDLRQNSSYSIYTNSSGTTGDGQFDFFPGLTVDLANGEVIFPTLFPFYNTLRQQHVPDSLIAVDTTIYANSQTNAQNSTIKFYMGGKATGDASSRYSLGFNVVEGSVKVYNGPVQLADGVDYSIDYSTGELVIRNASALSAGASLKITYESNDLFQLASKTLLGTRAEYDFNKTSYLGFTLLNLQQQTLNDKVRIGEEPTNNTIMGFDASTDIKTNFLTNLVNKIPGYNTKEESILNLKGEVAYMLPDPNTKKSRIPSDNGESVSYIDDFEGAKKVISLGLSPLSWTVSSIPTDSILGSPFTNLPGFIDTVMSLKRCKMTWFNLINAVNVHDVYPNRQIGSNQSQTLTPLELDFYPFTPGMYTYADSLTFINRDHGYGPPEKKWAGIFKYLNTSITNLVDENIGFVQIWMKILNPTSIGDSAKMMVDLGVMTEKIVGNYRTQLLQAANSISTINTKNFFTEDLNSNGILDANEDNGITGLSLSMENQIFPHGSTDSVGYGNNPRNPSRDQYFWNQGSSDFSHFNGTRGNSALSEGRRIDGEDLNGNGVLDETNNYYEYSMPLTSDSTKNKYITGGGNNGWYQYSIPLNDFYKLYGSSGALTNVQYVRVWFKGMSQPSSLQIVEFDLVGNQWQKTNKNDTTYSISSVNIEENSNIYQPPVPGDVLRQSDPTQVDQTVLQNEQSISVEVRNLYQGQGKFATKFFNTKPINLLNYKIVKLFVNNDPNFNYTDTGNYDAAMVVRLGSDSGNYYEYRAPLQKETRPNSPWNPLNEVTINLTDLTQVKQFRDSAITVPKYIPVPHGPPGSKYGVLGSPTISSITMISLGVVNNRKPISAHPITGSVWFDELRVLKTNDKSGYAYTFNAALKIADLGNVNFNFSKTDPNFHALEDRFGSSILSTNWELSGTLNIHKILNSLMASLFSLTMKDFFNIPLTFSHSESYDKPQFVPNSDIDLETAAQNMYSQVLGQTNGNQEYANYKSNQLRIASQTLTISNRIAINGFKFTLPGDNFFIQELLNKMELSFYRNSTTLRSPTSQSNYAWEMGGSLGINSNLKLLDIIHLNIGIYLPLGDEYKDAKLYFFLPFFPLIPLFTNTLGLGTNFTRSRGDEQLRNQLAASPTTRNFNATRSVNMDWKFIENWIVDLTGNYTFGAGSDLTFLETTADSLRQQRANSQILHDIFFNGSLINFGKDINYNQTININPKFNLPIIKNFLDLTSSYRVQYGWAPSLQTINLGSTVSYNADFQSSAYLKIKQILDIFKSGSSTNKMQGMSGSLMQNDNKQSLGDLFSMLGTFLPNQVSISYGQNKTVTNGGVVGRPGFANFWVNYGTKEDMGPSRLYQLGWANDPGKRVGNVVTQDVEGYTNTLTLSTFINPIFPDNLKISLTYKTDWSRNKNSSYQTDPYGNLGAPTSILGARTITRPTFFFGTDLTSKLPTPTNPLTMSDEISSAFEKSVVSFPFPSWDLNLTGIEKFEMFSSFASTISLETAYSSDYKKTLKFNGNIPEYIESQSIISGYSPLVGINVTFKEIQGGSLTASVKINKTNNFDVNPQSATINITSTTDYSINTSYTKSGFKIPLFGLSLDNDLSIAFSYTRTTNDPRQMIYRIDQAFWDSSVLNGSISTSLNPSIQYALSKSVTVQLFYKYSKIEPNAGSQQIPTTTSNEAGLNLKLAIQ